VKLGGRCSAQPALLAFSRPTADAASGRGDAAFGYRDRDDEGDAPWPRVGPRRAAAPPDAPCPHWAAPTGFRALTVWKIWHRAMARTIAAPQHRRCHRSPHQLAGRQGRRSRLRNGRRRHVDLADRHPREPRRTFEATTSEVIKSEHWWSPV